MYQIMCYDNNGNTIDYLTQWDLGQIIYLKNLNFDTAPIVHIHSKILNKNESITITSKLNDNNTISFEIPNFLLQKAYPIAIYFYHETDKSGTTICTTTIPVKSKAKPSNYQYVENVSPVSLSEFKSDLEQIVLDFQSDLVSKASENLFEYSEDNILVGYKSKATSIDAEMLKSFEVSTDYIQEDSAYTLYNKIIPVLTGEEYALSENFRGFLRLYDVNGEAISDIIQSTNTTPLPSGKNCCVLTIPNGVCYVIIHFISGANIDYSTFRMSLGTEFKDEITLNEDIKINYNQIKNAPEIDLSDYLSTKNIDNKPNKDSLDSDVVSASVFYNYFQKLLKLSNKQLCTTTAEWELGNIDQTDGSLLNDIPYARTVDYINISVLKYPVTVVSNKSSVNFNIIYYNDDGTYNSRSGFTTSAILDPSIAPKVKILVNTKDITETTWTFTLDDVVNTIQITLTPILSGTTPPSSTTIGTVKTLYLCKKNNKDSLYMCFGLDESGYIWHNLLISDVLRDYVKNTLTIAGLGLSKNITITELQEALNIMTRDRIVSSVDDSSTNEQVVGAKLFKDQMNSLVVRATENLFKYSEENLWLGYNSYGNLVNDVFENLEFDSNSTDSVAADASYTLYKKVIPVSQDDTYAITKGFRGFMRFYDANGKTRAYLRVTDSESLIEGETCDTFMIPKVEGYELCYMALSFNNYANIDYSTFNLVKGTEIRESNTLNQDIKVNYSQLYGVPYDSNNGEDNETNSDNNTASSDAYSHYDELNEYAELIQDAQTPSTFTMCVMADTHYSEANNLPESLDTANRMALLSNFVHVDAIGNLGDLLVGKAPLSETRKDLSQLLVNTVQNAKCPVFIVKGNHDDNGWYSQQYTAYLKTLTKYEEDYNKYQNGELETEPVKPTEPEWVANKDYGTYKTNEIFNDKQWYQMAFNFTRDNVVIDENKPNGGYGYYDHNASKIRVFLLNTNDFPYIVEDNGSYRYNSYETPAISNEQLNFVANALKFEDKDNPSEWAAMFLMHIPLDTTTYTPEDLENGERYRFGGKQLIMGHDYLLAIISAYRKGVAFKASGSTWFNSQDDAKDDFLVDIDVDYSNKGYGEVIAFINGHTHMDNCSQKVGYENSLSRGYSYLGFIGMVAFATLVVNRECGTVTAFKYGEVRPQSVLESTNNDARGAINGEKEFGITMTPDTESGEKFGTWTVPYDQFLPRPEDNLFTGNLFYDAVLDESAANQYITDNLHPENYAISYEGVCTYAIPVKPFTTYVIPSDFIGKCCAYRRPIYFSDLDATVGKKNSYPTIKQFNDKHQIVTTEKDECYLVFSSEEYTDQQFINDFYIRELMNEDIV